jgi:hypothetical protein
MNTDADTGVRDVAELVYGRFSAGFTTGAWDPFFELVTDEVDFVRPTGPGAGRFSGTEGRTLMDKSPRLRRRTPDDRHPAHRHHRRR